MSSIHLNATRVEQLVEQLNGLNKRLMGLEGKLLRYALSCKIKREDFLDVYQKSELDPNWVENISHKKDKHWQAFVEKYGMEIVELRDSVAKWRRNAVCRFQNTAVWSIRLKRRTGGRSGEKGND